MSVVVSAVFPSLVDQVTESLVYGIESCANGTASQAPFQLAWTTFADAVEWYDIGLTTTTVTMALRTTTSPWIDSTAFAFALVGAVITAVAYAQHSKQLAIESLVLSGASAALDGAALSLKVVLDRSGPGSVYNRSRHRGMGLDLAKGFG